MSAFSQYEILKIAHEELKNMFGSFAAYEHF